MVRAPNSDLSTRLPKSSSDANAVVFEQTIVPVETIVVDIEQIASSGRSPSSVGGGSEANPPAELPQNINDIIIAVSDQRYYTKSQVGSTSVNLGASLVGVSGWVLASGGATVQHVLEDLYGDLAVHAGSTDHDGRYYTETEVDTILGDYQARAEKNQPNGYPGLDTEGEIPFSTLAYHNHNSGIEGNPTYEFDYREDGTYIRVAEAECWFALDEEREEFEYIVISGSDWIKVPDEFLVYLTADAHTSTWTLEVSLEDIRYVRHLPYLTLFKNYGSPIVHVQNIALHAHGETEEHHRRIIATDTLRTEAGALQYLSVASGTGFIDLNGGGVWLANNRIVVPEITETTLLFFIYRNIYNDLPDFGYEVAMPPVVETMRYNPEAGLEELNEGHWTVNYLWRSIEENQDILYLMVGPEEYETEVAARASSDMGRIFPLLDTHTLFIGRIIVQKGDPSTAVCESAFTTNFVASTSITNHNLLTGKQGGEPSGDEFFHLSDELYLDVTNMRTIASGIANTRVQAHEDTEDAHTEYLLENGMRMVSGDLVGTDFIKTRSGTITRGIDGKISSVSLIGGRTLTINRGLSGKIESVYDGVRITTLSRDGEGKISGWTIA